MGTEGQLSRLRTVADGLKKINKDKLLRPNLGEASIKEAFGERLDSITKKLEFAIEFGQGVHDNVVSSVASYFEQILSLMEAHVGTNNSEYVAQRDSFLNNIDNQLQQLLQYWPPFITAAIEARGFLQDEGIRKEYQRTIDSMKEESASALKLVKDEAAKTIAEAQKLAQQIEERARRTAAHISVEEAQKQFADAQKQHRNQVVIWSVLVVVSLLGFFGTAFWLVRIELPQELRWHVLYYTAVRVTILTGVGAIAAFCFRMLRANLHMYQHNLHRRRLTNSMAALVESAITPEQRDLILAHLVDAIATFGSSGLLEKQDDSIHSPRIIMDTIQRTITPPSPKS